MIVVTRRDNANTPTGCTPVENSTRASLVAGAVASVVGVVFFATVHWYFVFPILDILFLGLFMVPPIGLAAGWALDELAVFRRLPSRHLAGPAFGLLLFATLIPIAGLAATHGNVDMNALTGTDYARLIIELLLLFPIGMAAGWALERRLQPSLAMGIAAIGVGVAIGHNIPILGSSPVAGKMYLVILATELVAGTVLAEIRDFLIARAKPPAA